MMYGVDQKVKNEAGIALVDSHLNANMSKEKLQMRSESRFAPESGDEENSSTDEQHPLGSPDELSTPDSNIITIESVESPNLPGAKADTAKQNKSAPFAYKKLPSSMMVGEIDSDFDPTKLVYVTPPINEEESK
jgi:hypothetical protein